ncbi:hypothetical protein IW262DRAFT_1458862 [Armillaria fumosa]|nr:hypothetical protein IW262DRAFT_1458862 [Armillaria fumosa]
MAIDDDTARQPDHMQNGQSSSPLDELPLANRVIAHNDTQTNTRDPSDKKGKKKASEKELVQQAEEDEEYCMKARQHDIEDEPIPSEVLEIADRIHGQDRVGELEERLKHAHKLLATALQHNRQLKHELEQATRGTKRPLSQPRGEPMAEQSSKRMRQPPTGPSSEWTAQQSPWDSHVDDELAGYLSDAPKWIIIETEGQPIKSKATKHRKKEGLKSKQIMILPCRIEYLAPRDGAAYLQDSRVHNHTITKGSLAEEWLEFLAGTMGIKPIHPDEPQPLVSNVNDSDSKSNDDNDEDSESWHVKWH